MALVRTRMGIYVLSDDITLSRDIDHFNTLAVPNALRDVAQVAPFIPEGGVVIDAGASLGDHTVLYSQIVGPEGKVHAFEPHAESYEALHANIERLNNVGVYQCGLSDVDEIVDLAVTPNIGASFVSPGGDHGFPLQSVTLMKLDGLFTALKNRDLDRLDFIHLDAEGYESKILTGAAQTIAKFRPLLLVEVQNAWLQRAGSSKEALIAQLTALNYVFAPITENPEQYDVFCLPAERYEVRRDGVRTDIFPRELVTS